jgi:DNA-binding LacI/PurR family transcriptional regulator
MVRLPANERPQALIVADEHLLEASLAGLTAAGVKPGKDLTVVSHGNFPMRHAREGVECIGFDVARLLQICIETVLNPSPSSRRAKAVGVPALLAEEWHAQQKK